jgi:hypothetical protein
MATYIFLARVRPEAATIRLDVTNPPLTLRVGGTSAKDCTLRLLLAGSDVALHVTTSEVVEDVATLKNQIQTVTNAIFDGTTYYTGLVVTVEITSVILEHPWLARFENKSEGVEREAHASALRHDIFFSLAIESVDLRSALSDLREAIRSPNDTGFFSYRAVETIMQSFRENAEEEPKRVWPRFRESLRISAEYVKAMTAFSTSNRHGVVVPVSAQAREELLIRARTVIHRFAAFLAVQRKPLSSSEFQELT